MPERPQTPTPAEPAAGDYPRLVARIQGGDTAAERELMENFGHGLMLMLRRLTGNPTLADDLHQETMALVLMKTRNGDVRNPEALAAFIRSTARNLFIADRRKEKRYSELDPVTENKAAHEEGQLSRLIRDEEAATVRRLLGELKHPRDRELLIRYYLGDDPTRDICRDVGVDPGRFNKVLFRARKRLRELWKKSEKRKKLDSPMLIFFGAVIFLGTNIFFPALLQ